MMCYLFFSLALCLAVSARPARRAAFHFTNGQDAINLNNQFKTLTAGSACTDGSACVGEFIAECVGGTLVTQPCPPSTVCAALPLDDRPGTVVSCTTAAHLASRIAETGAEDTNTISRRAEGAKKGSKGAKGSKESKGSKGSQGGNAGGDPQKSLTLDPAVIAKGFANDGQDVPVKDQVASLTSSNNFINFCATLPDLPITNGKQIPTGSCNPAPIGVIPSTDKMPSSKFSFPKNGGTIPANKKFTISMAIKNLETGNFVNAQQNYFSAPQQLNKQGTIRGHSHVVVEKLNSFDQTTPTNPNKFVFFKGLNEKAQGGVLSAEVAGGLPAGVYRLSSINTAANHQPVIVPVAQHGFLDDAIYFTVTADGKPAKTSTGKGKGKAKGKGGGK